jgi:transposase
MTFEGMCDRFVVEAWLKDVLLPTLSKGYTIIMDNAAYHKGGKIAELIKKAGCKLLYLPPYSPDLNPIEKCWNSIKSKAKHAFSYFFNPTHALDFILSQHS